MIASSVLSLVSRAAVTSRILYQHPCRHSLRSSSLRAKSTTTSTYEKITFIGTGKMAQALIAPLIETSIQPAEKITVYDVSTSSMKQIASRFKGVQTSESIPQAIEGSDLVIMAVKPQNVNNVYNEMSKSNIRDDATLLSVIAGKTIENLVSGSGIRKVCRSMPNTPAIIGQGMTVWCCTTNIPSEERDKISSVLDSFGKSIFGRYKIANDIYIGV
jgi:pyrroline-5-carboxylate reductase